MIFSKQTRRITGKIYIYISMYIVVLQADINCSTDDVRFTNKSIEMKSFNFLFTESHLHI